MGSMNPQVKNCSIRLVDIGTEGYELPPAKTPLTKEQKRLLLHVKKSAKQKKADTKTPKRGKKSKDGKFQMKIAAFLSPPTKKIRLEGDGTPPTMKIKLDEEVSDRLNDSGVTASNKEDAEEDEKEVDKDVEEAVEKEKSKFKEELSEEELSSSEEEESEEDWDDDDDDAFSKKKTAVSRKPAVKRKRKFLAPIVIPGAMKSELALSDYEKIRNDNIKEREEMLARLMADFDQFKQDNGLSFKPAPKKRKKVDRNGSFQSGAHVPLTRRKSSRLTDQEKKDTFGSIEWMTPVGERRKLAEDSDYEEMEDRPNKRKRGVMPSRWAVDPNVDIIMPEDVTPAMLKKISFMGSGKKYDTVRGTSCHQCRQKTIDQKTICRSGDCSGVRGQFCGACLRNRYGEDASEALLNPTWKCPPCLGICNCSICRNRAGKGATGILIHLAQSKGFDNVNAYLLSLQKNKGTDEFDE